jgi:SAM-dependent methyltransferase
MLKILISKTEGMNVTVAQADACDLPYSEGRFAWAVCQFGVMFFPDRPKSFACTHRVLKTGGRYLFNVWDSLEHNDFARCVNGLLNEMFPDKPPKFYETPFGYHDTDAIRHQLEGAGFARADCERLTLDCTGESVQAFCHGLIDGNPILLELQELGQSAVDDARSELCRRLKTEYGDNPFKCKMQAIVVEARK